MKARVEQPAKATADTPDGTSTNPEQDKLSKPHPKSADAKAKAEYKRLAKERKAANKAAKKERERVAMAAAQASVAGYFDLAGPKFAKARAGRADSDEGGEEHDVGCISVDGVMERRLIVECLLVRKMSIEEAYLDFGGFSISI